MVRCRLRLALAALVFALAACRPRAATTSEADAAVADAGAPRVLPDAGSTALADSDAPLRLETGADFPDRVVALTWDDGPDVHTLELARFLRASLVPATFFVVDAWVEGTSEEPGHGPERFRTGATHLPILGELVALGHRLGNHTRNHVLLPSAPADLAVTQVRDGRAAVARFVGRATVPLRPPAGAWTGEARARLREAKVLRDDEGPFGWDVDGKDWEASLWCRSDRPDAECEPGPIPGERRVRADVVAKRYLDRIVAAGRGIVLLHDRVGDVGSRYALDVAKRLVPALVARGFVFAPVHLGFRAPEWAADASRDAGVVPASRRTGTKAPEDVGAPIGEGDLNGDGRADVCGLVGDAVMCALARPSGGHAPASRWATWSTGGETPWLVDVDGDGRVDLCGKQVGAIACALAP